MINFMLLFFSFILISCGTDTGNPGQESSHDNSHAGVDAPPEKTIQRLVSVVCNKITSCHDVIVEDCAKAVFNLENVDTEIGIEEFSYNNLHDVQDALTSGELLEDPAAINNCFTDIEFLSCESEEVTNAYQNNSASSYHGVAKMLPQVCEKSLSQP